jgi:hypothetical protein
LTSVYSAEEERAEPARGVYRSALVFTSLNYFFSRLHGFQRKYIVIKILLIQSKFDLQSEASSVSTTQQNNSHLHGTRSQCRIQCPLSPEASFARAIIQGGTFDSEFGKTESEKRMS